MKKRLEPVGKLPFTQSSPQREEMAQKAHEGNKELIELASQVSYSRLSPTPAGGNPLDSLKGQEIEIGGEGGRIARSMLSPELTQKLTVALGSIGQGLTEAATELSIRTKQMGRIQAGTRALMGVHGVGRKIILPPGFELGFSRFRVGIVMVQQIHRTPSQPFEEGLKAFNKKAKKLRKQL